MQIILISITITIVVWALVSNFDFFAEKNNTLTSWNSNFATIQKSNNLAFFFIKIGFLCLPFFAHFCGESYRKFKDKRAFKKEQKVFLQEVENNEDFLAEKSIKEIQKYLKVDKKTARALKKNSEKTKKIKVFAFAVTSAMITFIIILTWKK